MKFTRKVFITFGLLLLNIHSTALAGFAGGPYVIWVNLSKNTGIDEMVAKHVEEKDDCIPPDAKFYLTKRPDSITDEIVSKAVLKNDKDAIQTLNKLLHLPYGNLKKGFDGVVVYDEHIGPRFSNIVTDWNGVARKKVPKAKSLDSSWETFCVLIPPITREP